MFRRGIFGANKPQFIGENLMSSKEQEKARGVAPRKRV